MPLSEEELTELEAVGVGWCNEAQFANLIAEVRDLRRDAAKWRELESKSKQALPAYKALDLSQPSLREQNAALRAQLDEAVKVLEATDEDGEFDHAPACSKYDCRNISPCCHMQARALLARLTRQTGSK